MKKEHKLKLHRGIVTCLSFFVLTCSTMIGQAQTTNNPNYFDTSASTTSWVTWWGGGSISAVNYSWDSAVDATNKLNSGSLLGVAPFTGVANDQFMTFCTFANRWQWDGGVTLNGRNYSTLSFDIRIEPSTGRTIAGNYGSWEFGFVPTGWDSGKLTTYSVTIPYTNAWVHVSVPIDPAAPNLGSIDGFFLKLWSNGQFTNSLTFHVDNIVLTENTAPPAPPVLSLDKNPIPGLNLFASGSGQYQRQNVRTIDTGFKWYNQPAPVTYSVAITNYPGTNNNNFQTHIFLVPGIPDPTRPDVDWHEPSVVFLDIHSMADGTAVATFRYKTNAPDGNTMIYGAGVLGSVTNGTILGTWSINFNQNTNITITAPGGSSNTFVMPLADAGFFNDLLRVYVGAQPNSANNIGKAAVLSRVTVTGAASALDDNFISFDASKWEVLAADPAGIILVPANARFWLNWTLPDIGFGLQANTNLAQPTNWFDPGWAPVQIGAVRKTLISTTNLPAPNRSFFRLKKP